MRKLTLEIPENVDEKKLKMSIAAMLFEQGILSSGQADKLVGITKRLFIEEVGKFDVSIFNESIEDLNTPIEL